MKNVVVRADNVKSVDGNGYLPPADLQTSTDASGRFELAGLPKGSCRLFPSRKGFYGLDPIKMYDVPADDVVIKLTGTGNVHGKVTQGGGAPTDGAYIARIAPEGGEKVGSWAGSSQVKADGSFEFNGVPPGHYVVTARLNPGPVLRGTDPSEKLIEIKPGVTEDVEIKVK